VGRKPDETLRRIIAAAIECSPRVYLRAATQRLDVARFLLNNSNYYLDAAYLAGYTAECALKALILERTPKAKRPGVCEELGSGARAHNFDVLENALRVKNCTIPNEVSTGLNHVKQGWGTQLRYHGGLGPQEAAESLSHDIILILKWVERGF
jgi:HEPN domain-containing protein